MTPRDPSNPKDRPMTTCNVHRTFGAAYVVTVPCFDNGDADIDDLCRADLAIALAALESGDVTGASFNFARRALALTRDALAVHLETSVAVIEAMERDQWLIAPAYVGRLLDLLRASDRSGFVARRA